MLSEDNPYRFVLGPLTAYRQRTPLEKLGQSFRAWWYRNEFLRVCVAWMLAGAFLWLGAVLAVNYVIFLVKS